MVLLVDLDGQDLWHWHMVILRAFGSPPQFCITVYHIKPWLLTFLTICAVCFGGFSWGEIPVSIFPLTLVEAKYSWHLGLWIFPFVKPILKDEVAFYLSYDDLYPGETQQFIKLLWASLREAHTRAKKNLWAEHRSLQGAGTRKGEFRKESKESILNMAERNKEGPVFTSKT